MIKIKKLMKIGIKEKKVNKIIGYKIDISNIAYPREYKEYKTK
jgi:hypothetical protein